VKKSNKVVSLELLYYKHTIVRNLLLHVKIKTNNMGNYLRTLRQKDSFYGDYVTGFHVVHRTIERSFQRIENIICNLQLKNSFAKDGSGNNKFAIEDKDFRRYVSLCLQFLSLHHKQEDKFIFPKFENISPELKNEIESKLNADHEEIELLLKEGIDILKAQSKDDNGVVTRGNTVIERSTRLKDIAIQIQSMMPNHLGTEEKYITEKFLRENLKLSEVYDLHYATHDMIDTDNDIVDSGERMDRKTSLVFLLYHLTEEERCFFDDRLPFFLKWWMFPRWAYYEGPEVFLNAPYCRKDEDGNLIF
jgi:hypothetical protein